MGTPSSIINICSGVMLDNSYKNTIWFESPSDQREYFEGKVVKSFSSYSYLRKHWNIDVQASPEQAYSWTYLFFQNSANGKVYYYFINDVIYVNEHCVTLVLELDYMQTYAFDYTLALSFVDREHIALDNIGDNVIAEDLDLGDYIVQSEQDIALSDLCILVLSSLHPVNTEENVNALTLGSNIDGVFAGLGLYAVDMADYLEWSMRLAKLDEWGKSDCIVSMWMYPKELVRLVNAEWGDDTLCKYVVGVQDKTVYVNHFSDTALGAYAPRNRKLFTHPYNLLYASNNSGEYAEYKFEHFNNPSQIGFRFTGALSPEGTCKLIPLFYKGDNDNYDEGITLGGFPSCAWNQDIYKLWLAQNQNTNKLAVVQGSAAIVGGAISTIATGGMGALAGMGTAYSGLNQIMGTLAKTKDMQVQPPQAKGQFSANVNIVNDKQTFTLQHKVITPYYARIVDDFFSMYGYKTNLVKIPNRHVRENWTYVRTIGCNVYGNICMSDLSRIASIFDNGITFWTQGDLIGNYSLSNKCLLEVNADG